MDKTRTFSLAIAQLIRSEVTERAQRSVYIADTAGSKPATKTAQALLTLANSPRSVRLAPTRTRAIMLNLLTARAFFLAALVNADRLGDAIRENPSGVDAPFDYLPAALCAGLKPCMHTTPADRAASRCTDIIWDGEWKNDEGASRSGSTLPTKTAVDTRFHFHPAADQACDVARAHKFSSLETIKGKETEATQNHLHERLAPLFGNRLWLTLGTSIDHRMTRNCPTMYGAKMVNKPGGWAGDLCVVPGLNLTIGYHFIDGLTTTHDAATAETQRAALAKVDAEWAKVGYPRGPDFVTFGGAE